MMRRVAVVFRPLLMIVVLATGVTQVCSGQTQDDQAKAAQTKRSEQTKAKGDLVPLKVKLPKPAFKGTPAHAPPGTRVKKPTGKPRPPFLAPKASKNVAKDKPVISSDMEPIIGEIKFATDGDKEANEGSYVELGFGVQWVQIDLKKKCPIQAILVWHYHMTARIYHDVVVQVADDKDFIENVRTVYNNDHDNSAGLGLGKDYEYWDTFEGLLIDAKGVEARYVRLYSNGSTSDDQNHYTEVEVYALPAK
jgi:hypothetical protein